MDDAKALFRRVKTPEEGGYPGFGYRTERDGDMLIERDVAVRLRDGALIYADVFRPADGQNVPAVIGWAPYGKHPHLKWTLFPGADVDPDKISEYTPFEAPDPVTWTRHGYALIFPDPRGTWNSQGAAATFFSPQEAEDGYDVVEWSAAQPWCSGKVGLAGVSYLAISQWAVAALRPPHLAAINPWEGCSDMYREFFFHGGIPSTRFLDNWETRTHARVPAEDTKAMTRERPLLDDYWREKSADLSRIEVPAFIVASWTDQGLHTRGTLEAHKRIASREKWLVVHGGKKWQYYYAEENVARQIAFFDHFLKGVESGIAAWPKVEIEVRERFSVARRRAESEWPLARTTYRAYYLDASDGSLAKTPRESSSSVRYPAQAERGVSFDHTFSEDTELTGHAKLRLWVSAEGADDMDLFVALEKLDREGNFVPFAFFNAFEDGPAALGWLRVSHRELDAERSTPEQPWHTHRSEQPLPADGRPVPVEIEIWPSSTRFAAGETLRLVVQGTDVKRYPPGLVAIEHQDTRNRGTHVIHTGGSYDAMLLVPVIPPRR